MLYNTGMKTRTLSNLFALLLALAGGTIALLLTVEHYLPSRELLPCSATGGGCKGIQESAYGQVGPIPTALFGLLMYLAIALLCALRHKALGALSAAEAKRAAAYAVSGQAEFTPESSEPDTDFGLPAEPRPAPETAETGPRRNGALDAATVVVHGAQSRLKILDGSVFALALAGVLISGWLQYIAIFVLHGFCVWCFTSASIVALLTLVSGYDFILAGRKLVGEQKLLVGVCVFVGALMVLTTAPQVIQQIILNIHGGQPDPPHVADVRQYVMKPDLHILGNPKAPYPIIEFADYQCPACKRSIDPVNKILARMGDKVYFAFRNFPLGVHAWSTQAAQAAEAAGLQGKFWQMHDTIYKHQDELEQPGFSPATFSDFASEAGLDVERFKRDVASKAAKDRVEQDKADGEAAQVRMTPSFFFVGPKQVWYFKGAEQLDQALQNPKHAMWK